MSTEITTAFVQQFTAGIRILQQQKQSNLRRAVRNERIKGDRAYFDQVAGTSMQAVSTRGSDTTYSDTPHRRRMVTSQTYRVADLVDKRDVVRLLNNPTNAYSRSFAMAANRQIDDSIVAAFAATASTGVDGSGTASFAATHQIANTIGATSGMNITKLLAAREILEASENSEEDEWFIVMSAEQRKDLLGTTEITSSDYASVKALVNGQISQFLGFTFLKSERLLTSGGDRLCYAWAKPTMLLATGEEPRGRITELPNKNYSTQVFMEMDCGAVRMDESGIVQIACDEPSVAD